MVGYDPKQVGLTVAEQSQVTAASSIIARFLIQPLDVIKIRFQVKINRF